MWWLPFVEFFGRIALKIGLVRLEKKYPGAAPLINQVVSWLHGQASSGNERAVEMLQGHFDKFLSAKD